MLAATQDTTKHSVEMERTLTQHPRFQNEGQDRETIPRTFQSRLSLEDGLMSQRALWELVQLTSAAHSIL